MAQRTVTIYESDLSKKEIPDGEAVSVTIDWPSQRKTMKLDAAWSELSQLFEQAGEWKGYRGAPPGTRRRASGTENKPKAQLGARAAGRQQDGS
jgi:hypothetical protein